MRIRFHTDPRAELARARRRRAEALAEIAGPYLRRARTSLDAGFMLVHGIDPRF
jgi:hypothetical protein